MNISKFLGLEATGFSRSCGKPTPCSRTTMFVTALCDTPFMNLHVTRARRVPWPQTTRAKQTERNSKEPRSELRDVEPLVNV